MRVGETKTTIACLSQYKIVLVQSLIYEGVLTHSTFILSYFSNCNWGLSILERELKVKHITNAREGKKTKQNIKTKKGNKQKTNSVHRQHFYLHTAKIVCFLILLTKQATIMIGDTIYILNCIMCI